MEGMKDLANLDFLPFETDTIIGLLILTLTL